MNRRPGVALGFLALIAVGAVLLSSPFARVAGTWGNPQAALFTACSAVCVTGLSVVDIAAEYSRAGQIILLCLVETGCLGLMTFGTFLLVAVGRRLSLSREFSLMNAYGVAQIHGLKGLTCWVVGSTVLVEAGGAALLYCGAFHEVYPSVFYSVMSFCNAGFGLFPGSLASFADRPLVLLVSAAEVVLGGIGFLVLYNVCTCKFLRRPSGGRGRLSLHTRVVLQMTFALLVLGFAAFLLAEWNGALAGMSPLKKLWIAAYQAVTPRTCGFSVVPTEGVQPVTRLVYEVLMFVGGAPGSAAAGLKVTTLAVIVYTVMALWRGDTETVIRRRVVSAEVVRESLVIFMALMVFLTLVMGALLMTERATGLAAGALFFEAVSAITTTGLSVGDTTARLSSAGRVVIMVAMFFGRLGALTVVLMIGERESKRHVRYPNEELVVG